MNNYNYKWLVFISTAIIVTLVNLDMTIVNLALPRIAQAFNSTLNQSKWIISSYFIAASLTFTIFGKVADIIGRKKVFILGVILFTGSSFFASLASNLPTLIAMRFIQGLGYAASFSLTFVIVAEHFPHKQRNFITGLLVITTGLGQSFGPIAGGVIIHYLSWHLIFLVNVPLGIISSLLAILYINKDEVTNKNRLNVSNTLLFLLGLAPILLTINQLSVLSNTLITLFIVIGIVFLTLFIIASHKQKNALIHLELLHHKSFALVTLTRFLFFTLFGGGLFVLPIYIQNILGFNTLQTGLIMLFLTACIAITSPSLGRLMTLFSYQTLIKISLVLAIITSLLILANGTHVNLVILISTLVVFGIAVGIHLPATIVGTRLESTSNNAATAMGLLFTATFSSAAISVGIAGALIHGVSHHTLMQIANHQQISQTVIAVSHGTVSILSLHNTNIRQLAASAFVNALHAIALFFLAANALGLVLSCYYWRNTSNKNTSK